MFCEGQYLFDNIIRRAIIRMEVKIMHREILILLPYVIFWSVVAGILQCL